MSGQEYVYAGLSRVLYHMQAMFSVDDILIMLLVLSLVTLLPLFLCIFNRRGSVRTVSLVVFAIYIFGNLFFTLLNREVLSESVIIIQPGSDFQSAFYMDMGILGFIREILNSNFSTALSSIHIQSNIMAREVLLNILLYFPMGYLLPFVFKSLRGHILLITLIGFLASCATEFTQLYFHLGVFQVDDIILNTLGAFLGAILGSILVWIWRVK